MFKSLSTRTGAVFIIVGLTSIYLAYVGRGTNTYFIFGGTMVFFGLAFIVSYARAKSNHDRRA